MSKARDLLVQAYGLIGHALPKKLQDEIVLELSKPHYTLEELLQRGPIERTREERMALLVAAKILNEDGNFCTEFFSEETIERNKRKRNESQD